MSIKLAVLPGDGIGIEIVAEAVKVLDHLKANGLDIEITEAPVGGMKTCRENCARNGACSACVRNWACSRTCAPPSCIRNLPRHRR